MTVIVESLNPAQKSAARYTLQTVNGLLDEIRDNEQTLQANFARLGAQLLAVRDNKFWIEGGHRSFGDYLLSLESRLRKGRTQLYACLSVAEKLLPTINEETLAQIGISKANELNRVMKQKGSVPAELVEKAADPNTSVKEMREAAFRELKTTPADDLIYWDGLGALWLTKEERAEIKQALDLAAKELDFPPEWNENTRKKESVLALAREFNGTYSKGS